MSHQLIALYYVQENIFLASGIISQQNSDVVVQYMCSVVSHTILKLKSH